MKLYRLIYLLLVVTIITSCGNKSEESDTVANLDVGKTDTAAENKLVRKKFTGEKKSYYPDKKIQTVVRYKNGRRDGKATNYYKNGAVCIEAEYKDGMKNGLYTWYFENGKPYVTIEYRSDLQNGWQKGYHYNGKVKYEAKFSNGLPCMGLKSYDAMGKPHKEVQLTVKDLGYNVNKGIYTIHLALTEPQKDIVYYVLMNDENKSGCFSEEMGFFDDIILPNDNGVGVIEIPLARGQYIMGTVTFAAKFATKYGVDSYVQRQYNLAAESDR